MEREDAFNLIKQRTTRQNLIKHMIAVEAIMKELAIHFNEDVKAWSLAGLLHDIDFENTEKNPEKHGLVATDILNGLVDEKIINAIKAHNFENTNKVPETKMEKALIAADSISGFVIACALVLPSKKINDVNVGFMEKKFKEKDFARNCKRERILFCEQIGLDKGRFFELSLKALQNLSDDLGL